MREFSVLSSDPIIQGLFLPKKKEVINFDLYIEGLGFGHFPKLLAVFVIVFYLEHLVFLLCFLYKGSIYEETAEIPFSFSSLYIFRKLSKFFRCKFNEQLMPKIANYALTLQQPKVFYNGTNDVIVNEIIRTHQRWGQIQYKLPFSCIKLTLLPPFKLRANSSPSQQANFLQALTNPAGLEPKPNPNQISP